MAWFVAVVIRSAKLRPTSGSMRALRYGAAAWQSPLARLGSFVTLIVGYGFAFDLFHRFDRGQPVIRTMAFECLLLFGLGAWVGAKKPRPEPPRWVSAVELSITAGLLAWALWRSAPVVQAGFQVRMNDIGETTERAVRLTFLEQVNPYVAYVAPGLRDRAYQGFKYGPGMLAGYLLCLAYDHGIGLKATNLVYLALATFLVGRLAARGSSLPSPPSEESPPRPPRASPSRLAQAAAAATACTLFLWPERLYHELFYQGVNDIFPVVLLLLLVTCIEQKAWLAAGLTGGLSLAAKFSPALFLLVLLVRRRVERRFVFGLGLGLLPIAPFALWDGAALARNAVMFHGLKGFDATSLYSIVPAELHWVFRTIQATAVVAFVAANFCRPVRLRALVFSFALLLVIIEATFTEVHANHLIWFMPFFALLFAWHRHGLAGLVRLGIGAGHGEGRAGSA